MSALWRFVRGLFPMVVVLALVVVALRLFYVDILVVPHNGMAPTITYGESVLVWRRAHADMGDVMVCEHPATPGTLVMGRAVAFAGHLVDSDGRGGLVVDSDRASVEWQGELKFFDVTREKLFFMRHGTIDYARKNRHDFVVDRDADFYLRTYQVNRGVYLLGDNRTDSSDDSREFGEVDPSTCKGQVFMRLRPAPPQEDDIHHGYLDVIW
jgi:signal peptidase I